MIIKSHSFLFFLQRAQHNDFLKLQFVYPVKCAWGKKTLGSPGSGSVLLLLPDSYSGPHTSVARKHQTPVQSIQLSQEIKKKKKNLDSFPVLKALHASKKSLQFLINRGLKKARQSQLRNTQGLWSCGSGQESNSSSPGLRGRSIVLFKASWTAPQARQPSMFIANLFFSDLTKSMSGTHHTRVTSWKMLRWSQFVSPPSPALPFPPGDSVSLTWGVRPGLNNFGWSES